MFKFAPYVLKSLWRHRIRSLLTVAGSAVALTLFCFVGAVQEGHRQLTEDRQAQRTLIVFQENRFCPQSSRLPEDYARRIERLPGVESVVPIKVFTNNCRASLDAIVFNGLPPEQLQAARKLTLDSGGWSEFERKTDAALVGRAVAQRRNLETGQQFSMGEVSVSIAGTFSSPVAAEENLIYTHLDFLQRAGGRSTVGTVTQLEVHLAGETDPLATAAAIDEEFRQGPVATTTRTKGVFQADTLADLVELIGMAHWLGYACVGLVLSLVATTTLMAVQDRVREHAVLAAIGVSPRRIFGLVLMECALLSLVGGLLGVGLGTVALAWFHFAVGAEGVSIAFEPSFAVALSGLAVSAAVGVLAGLAPAWQAARTEIVAALRQA